ncbi:alpha/beta hydrolase fold domain-containing protein [Streptomyces sp. NPDC002754]
MSDTTAVARPPEPDWQTITTEELLAYREAENRFRASAEARTILGETDPDAEITWHELPLPDRRLPVRVYRPKTAHDGHHDTRTPLPLVLHVHGGGFAGTAVQCDWANSHLAVHLPALVVSVEHRLLAPGTTLADAADDAWDALRHIRAQAERWGADLERTVVFGESCGALISALTALRARDTGLRLRAQVLVNPAVDLTGSMLDHASVARHTHTPTLALPQLRLFQRLAVPPGTDPRALSPLHAEDLGGLAPALVVVPTADPLADHGRRYAEGLRAAGTPVRLTAYPDAPHAFLTLPGMVEQAAAARTEILDFLRVSLAG